MEEKYYTPEIEDIRVKYECEMRQGDNWIHYNVPYNDCLSDFANMEDSYRTPYLTKEQIEDEGWLSSFYKDSETPHFIKKEFECFLYENNVITIVSKNYDFLYKGECKSVNEFRTICKWLKI